MILYHGTTKRALAKILKEGIKPRGDKKSNWDGFGTSRPDLVYLSNCYAPYYAFSACKAKGDKGVIIKLEIDPKKIKLYPDEEFIFNCSGMKEEAKIKGNGQELWDMIDPKKFERLFDSKDKKWVIGWKKSLEYLGTVTAESIPKECIVGFYVEKKSFEFVLHCDPSISPLNYKICGQMYKDYLESLEYIKIRNEVNNMAKKYIWWIGDKTGQIGAWPSEAKAQKAIDKGLKSGFLSSEKTWEPIRHETEPCPTCNCLAEKDIIEGLGECLSCDHVRGDL